MGQTFEKCMDFVLSHEGGYVNDPVDPGGETKYGIAKRYNPEVDIKNLTREEALKIYHKKYWLTSGCAQMKWPMNLVVMDTAVNMGVSRAKKFLEESGGDWKLFCILRMDRYISKIRKTPAKAKYYRGWHRRVDELMEKAVRR